MIPKDDEMLDMLCMFLPLVLKQMLQALFLHYVQFALGHHTCSLVFDDQILTNKPKKRLGV